MWYSVKFCQRPSLTTKGGGRKRRGLHGGAVCSHGSFCRSYSFKVVGICVKSYMFQFGVYSTVSSTSLGGGRHLIGFWRCLVAQKELLWSMVRVMSGLW